MDLLDNKAPDKPGIYMSKGSMENDPQLQNDEVASPVEISNTTNIIKRALSALTLFQNENEQNLKETASKESMKKGDKWQRLHDLRNVLVKLSGSPHTPVKDLLKEYLESQRSKPAVVRLLDKFAFLWGVLSLMLSEYVLLATPHYFWLWYFLFMSSMLAARLPAYLKKKWQYFLLDFCYFAQVCNFVQILFFPSSCLLFKVNFAFSVGPLCAAVVLWRNSLVFHDNERVTTVWIHILPSWFVYAVRWSDVSSSTPLTRLSALTQCEDQTFRVSDIMTALTVYLFWQFAYFMKTEVLDGPLLDKDPSIQTSLRWLALDTERPIHKLVLGVLRGAGVMRKDERFDPTQLKTKLIFMASQFIFTALAMLPVPLVYHFKWFSALYISGIFCVSVYNGGEYYIDVFSRRYYRQFEQDQGMTLSSKLGDVHDDHVDGPKPKPKRN